MKLRGMEENQQERKINELIELLETFDEEHQKKLVRLLQLVNYIYEELSIGELLYGIIEKQFNIDSHDIEFRKSFNKEYGKRLKQGEKYLKTGNLNSFIL